MNTEFSNTEQPTTENRPTENRLTDNEMLQKLPKNSQPKPTQATSCIREINFGWFSLGLGVSILILFFVQFEMKLDVFHQEMKKDILNSKKIWRK